MSRTKKEDNEISKPRVSRYIGCILYPDNELQKNVIYEMSQNPRCVGAFHDKDYDDDHKLKKPHYHMIMKFEVASTEGSLIKCYPDIPDYQCYTIRDFGSQARYLLHLDNPEKTLYDDTCLIGNISLVRQKILCPDRQNQGFMAIKKFIQLNKVTKLSDVIDYVNDNDLWSSYRAFKSDCYYLCRENVE